MNAVSKFLGISDAAVARADPGVSTYEDRPSLPDVLGAVSDALGVEPPASYAPRSTVRVPAPSAAPAAAAEEPKPLPTHYELKIERDGCSLHVKVIGGDALPWTLEQANAMNAIADH